MGALTENRGSLTGDHQEERCPFGRLYDGLDDEDRATLNGWIESDRSPTWIHQELRRAHLHVARETVTTHLSGRCICG
jgi:hypothetical protein